MSEYLHVEKPFLDQLAALGWQIVDQGQGMIPADPAKSLRTSFREWLLPEVFRDAVRAINLTPDGEPLAHRPSARRSAGPDSAPAQLYAARGQ